MTRTPSDITVVVSIEAFPARAVVAVEVADGSEQDRADVTRLIVAHLGTLWTELDDRVRAVEHRRQEALDLPTIGMSRASWYRHGKPSEKPKRSTNADEARKDSVSLRTYQRMMRVIAQSPELTMMMARHGWKPGQCEWVLTNPPVLRKFLREYRKAKRPRDEP